MITLCTCTLYIVHEVNHHIYLTLDIKNGSGTMCVIVYFFAVVHDLFCSLVFESCTV